MRLLDMAGGIQIGDDGITVGTDGVVVTDADDTPCCCDEVPTVACTNCIGGVLPAVVPVTFAGLTTGICCNVDVPFSSYKVTGTAPNGTYDVPIVDVDCGGFLTTSYSELLFGQAYEGADCTLAAGDPAPSNSLTIIVAYNADGIVIVGIVTFGTLGGPQDGAFFHGTAALTAPYDCFAPRTISNAVGCSTEEILQPLVLTGGTASI